MSAGSGAGALKTLEVCVVVPHPAMKPGATHRKKLRTMMTRRDVLVSTTAHSDHGTYDHRRIPVGRVGQ
jgi:hypothetical protein